MLNVKSPEFIYTGNFPNRASGSLNGLRLGVKDLFHITGIPTTAGNPDWLTSHSQPATVTAPSVTTLLAAGAVLLGKTLTDELAYSLEGVNKHYGTPINPQAPNRIPGGSSSGSAVAVANGSIDIGLGTDTGGSIRVPASYNGIYGFRPSHGAISCEHLIPLSPRFDTVGWLTSNLENLVKVADLFLQSNSDKPNGQGECPTINGINRPHSGAEAFQASCRKTTGDATQRLSRRSRASLRSLCHLVVSNFEDLEVWQSARQPLLQAWSTKFESIEYVDLKNRDLNSASTAFRILQGREIWREHGQWIERVQPDFAPEISDRFTWCKSLTQDDEQQAEAIARDFIHFWHTDILPDDDRVLLLPTTPGAAPLLNTPTSELLQYRSRLMNLTAPAGLTRAPQISLPYLNIDRAPWGISLLARKDCDRALLDCAAKLDS